MPELPEVEVTRQGLLPLVVGRRITDLHRSGKKLRAESSPQLLRRCLIGSTILTVDRRAKYLLLRMREGATLVIHLGMSGKLSVVSKTTPADRHDHLRLTLDNDEELRFNDIRRFGSVLAWPAAEAEQSEAALNARLGVEPLGPAMTATVLHRLAVARNQPVKNYLMDSRVVVGIGNIYANEILHAAGLHPLTPASRLGPVQWKSIVAASRRILKMAIRAGGSTIADFLGASGHPGYFQLQFKVYKRQGQQCGTCGQVIIKILVGGRATYFCPQCQRASQG